MLGLAMRLLLLSCWRNPLSNPKETGLFVILVSLQQCFLLTISCFERMCFPDENF